MKVGTMKKPKPISMENFMAYAWGRATGCNDETMMICPPAIPEKARSHWKTGFLDGRMRWGWRYVLEENGGGQSMKVGTKVKWESQSQGYSRKKEGVIVAVVPPETDVIGYIPDGMVLPTQSYCRFGESYLVQVGSSKRVYWPRVKHLREVK